MTKFEGQLQRERNGRKLVLNDEQLKWLKRWFPVTENKRLARAMGIGLSKLHNLAREYGLTKSEKGWEAICKRRNKAAAITNERNGCYDRKRGHPCSAATMEGVRKRFEDERLGLRENPQLRIKREEPEKYKAWIAKRSAERKEAIRKEKLRLMYGLQQQTRLKVAVLVPFTRSQKHHRYNALLRGYFLDEDCSESSPNRYVIFYDNNTKRSERFEKNCIADGFRFVFEE